MKKNIGKWKQWTNEKLGSGQKTQTTEEFQELQLKTDMRHNGFDKLHVATSTYLKTMSKKKESVEDKTKTLPIESLGATMRVYGEELGTDSPYGLALARFGVAKEKIANAQMEYVSRVREEFFGGLETSIAELKQYQTLKRKLESRRLDYDAKLNKVQKSKKEKPGLEEEMNAAKQKYEETMDETNEKMIAINESEGQYIQELTAFLDAELEFFKKGYEILSAVRDDWIERLVCSVTTRRTPARSATKESINSHSDDPGDDGGNSEDNESIHSSQSGLGRKETKDTPNRSSSFRKSSRSDSLNVPSSKSRASKAPPSRKPDRLPSPTQKKQVKALYSFEGDGDDELAIEVDDIITVLEEIDEGWWIGEILDDDGTRRQGMFPANYTEEVETLPQIPARRAKESPRQYEDQPEEDPYEQDEEEGEEEEEELEEQEQPEEEEEEEEEELPPKKPATPSRQTSFTTSPSRSSTQRFSYTSKQPPVPSRSSKPPVSSTSSARASPRKPSSDSHSPKIVSPSGGSRNSYIPQDYFSKKAEPQEEVGPCGECGCDDYSPDLFKKGKCNNCFHKH